MPMVHRGGNPYALGYSRNHPDALSTRQVVSAWAGGYPPPNLPASSKTTFTFWNGVKLGGPVHVAMVPAMKALDAILKKHSYHPYPGWNWGGLRRRVRGGNSWSTHSGFSAIDLNAPQNPFSHTFATDMPVAMVNDILALRTGNGKPVWAWGGGWKRRDAMHFQAASTPADMATGINGTSSSTEGQLVATKEELDTMRRIVFGNIELGFRLDRGRWMNARERGGWWAHLSKKETLEQIETVYTGDFLGQLSGGEVTRP